MILVESVNSVKDFGASLPVEGIFIFGGKKGADFIATNEIFVIPLKKSMTRALENYFLQTTKEAFTKKYGMLSHYWFKLPTLGTPPCPRYSHHASFLQNRSQMVIYGGRNNEVLEVGMDAVLSDMHVLDLVYLCWCRVESPESLQRFGAGPRYAG